MFKFWRFFQVKLSMHNHDTRSFQYVKVIVFKVKEFQNSTQCLVFFLSYVEAILG